MADGQPTLTTCITTTTIGITTTPLFLALAVTQVVIVFLPATVLLALESVRAKIIAIRPHGMPMIVIGHAEQKSTSRKS